MSEPNTLPRIGFIGLGIMGRPMVRNLRRAGFRVAVWARREEPVREAAEAGATPASSPSAVADQSDVVITMVTDSPDVEAVVLGPAGILEGARAGTTIIDMSTISPEVTRRIAAKASEKGVAYLDAPVTGGDVGAINATLSIMVGGDEAVFQRCRPIFETLGKTITYLGPVGSGQACKLCNQIAGAMNLLGLCEALILGESMGTDLEKMLAVVGGGAASNWAVHNLGPRILKRDFAPGFMIRLMQKDLRLVLDSAAGTHTSVPGTSLANQLFNAVEAAGGGECGTQALVQALEALAGRTVGK